jgi:hypothetical protein
LKIYGRVLRDRKKAIDLTTALLLGRGTRMQLNKRLRAALRIQSRWNMFRRRRTYRKLLRTAIRFQSTFRMFKQRQHLELQHASAKRIQMRGRALLDLLAHGRKVAAAISVQAAFRGLRSRSRLAVANYYARKAQAAARRFLNRRRLRKKKVLVAKLLRVWNVYKAREYVASMRAAAGAIVGTARMHMERQTLAAERAAATRLTKIARSHLAKKRMRWLCNIGPSKVQNAYRRVRARKIVGGKRLKEEVAVLAGRYWRSQAHEQAKVQAATRVATCVRRYQMQTQYKRKVLVALPRIQGLARMIRDKKVVENERRARQSLLDTCRGFLFRSRMKRRVSAARSIQRAGRRFLVSRRCRTSAFWNQFLLREHCATRIQALRRGHKERMWYARRLSAVRRIQGGMRCWQRMQYKAAAIRAATQIQATIMKRHLAWKKVNEKRVALIAAQAVVQRALATMRVWLMRTRALTIQSWWREVLSRKRVRSRHEVQIMISKLYRGKRDRRRALRRAAAAAHVNKTAWSFLRRRARLDKNKAAIAIQRVRYYLQFRRVMQRFKWVIVQIQKFCRGRQLRMLMKKRDAGFVLLQAGVRGMATRQIDTTRAQDAAIAIQKIARGWIYRNTIRRKNGAAVKIQAIVRRNINMGKLARVQRTRKMLSCAVIKYRFRCEIYYMKVLYEKCSKAFIEYKPVAARKRVKFQSVRLQSSIRGFLGRQRVSRLHRASRKIQACWFRWAAQRKADQRLAAITTIQAGFKQCLVQQWCTKAHFHIRRIQLYYRSRLIYLAHEERKRSAKSISRAWRAISSRREYVREMELVRNAVKTIEGARMRRQYLELQKQAYKLQAQGRVFLEVRRLQHKSAAANVIQTAWRCYSKWNAYGRLRRAAERIMMSVIGWRFRKLLLRKFAAATRIGARWRGYCVRANDYDRNVAAARIQRAFRQNQVSNRARVAAADILALTESKRFEILPFHFLCVKLQRVWRSHVDRRNDQLYRSAFSKAVRDKTRTPIRLVSEAAVTIQAGRRGIMTRRGIRDVYDGDFEDASAATSRVLRATFSIYVRGTRAALPGIMVRALPEESVIRCRLETGPGSARQLVPAPAGTRSALPSASPDSPFFVEPAQRKGLDRVLDGATRVLGSGDSPRRRLFRTTISRVDLSKLTDKQVEVLTNTVAPLQGWWRYKAKMHAIVRIQRRLRAIEAGALDRRAVTLLLAHQGRPAIDARLGRPAMLAQEDAERPPEAPAITITDGDRFA